MTNVSLNKNTQAEFSALESAIFMICTYNAVPTNMAQLRVENSVQTTFRLAPVRCRAPQLYLCMERTTLLGANDRTFCRFTVLKNLVLNELKDLKFTNSQHFLIFKWAQQARAFYYTGP